MDKASLEEYIAKEREKCEKLEEKMFDKSQKKPISVSDFFPEYKSEHTSSYSNYTHDETIPVQLPFSRGLYWGFRPYKTENMFEEQYGISVEESIELIGRKLLKPILSSKWYRYIDLDYLDPILDKKPPTYIRFTGFFNVLSGRTRPVNFTFSEYTSIDFDEAEEAHRGAEFV